MKIEIKMFGPFRALGDDVSLTMPSGSHVADIRPAMETYINKNEGDVRLVKTLPVSRFSTEKKVLSDTDPLSKDLTLYILPPVAGG